MKILLDENVAEDLIGLLTGHDVRHTRHMGWASLRNGVLLQSAIREGFEVFITADKNLAYQQNLKKLEIAILVLDIHPTSVDNQLSCLDSIKESLPTVKQGMATVIKRFTP